MFRGLREQIKTAFRQDPAARSTLEVLACYPGIQAIIVHRLAHRFYRLRLFLVARLISNFARWMTGIEIHPGAQVGRRFFIDHGMGVVIGETAVIGDDVLIYQGVTLGGTGHEKGKRHPTIGNHVVIGSGAKVLGAIDIGDWVRVGAGSVVVRPVPEHSTVVGIPGRVVKVKGVAVEQDEWSMLEHGLMPDPVGQTLSDLTERVGFIEERMGAEPKEKVDFTGAMSGG